MLVDETVVSTMTSEHVFGDTGRHASETMHASTSREHPGISWYHGWGRGDDNKLVDKRTPLSVKLIKGQ